MELLSFYALNIIVGAILATILGLYGSHVVSRNKTVETILLGQSIQVGILLGVIFGKSFTLDHDDHGLHAEILFSTVFTAVLYGVYEWISRTRKFAKTPILVTLYTVLVALSYLIIAASPIIESHMVKAFLGDIVTASKLELTIILIISLVFFVYFKIKNKILLIHSFDLSSFGQLLTLKHKKDYFYFNIIVLVLMIYSIHVLGIVFTLMMMIFPVTLMQFSRFTVKDLYFFIFLFAPSSVMLGFLLNVKFENFPTSSLMVMCYLGFGIVAALIKRNSNQ